MNRFVFFFILITLSGTPLLFGQSQQIAEKYFKENEFEKAYVYYKKSYNKSPNTNTLKKMVECKQQLGDYKTSQSLLEKHTSTYYTPEMDVLLGYNLQLQEKKSSAKKYYEKAIKGIEKNSGYAYSVGMAFQNYFLSKYTLRAYKKGMSLNEDLNLDYLIGVIYGELRDLDNMFKYYFNYLKRNPSYKSAILSRIKDFISSDPLSEQNIKFKKALLLRSQNTPNPMWNSILSWLFVTEKQYQKAFLQLKAIYIRERTLGTFDSIYKLALVAKENQDIESAKLIFKYLTKEAQKSIKIKAHLQLIEMALDSGKKVAEVDTIYRELVLEFKKNPSSIPLLKSYAEFIAYQKNIFLPAEKLIKECMSISLDDNESAQLKITLGDIAIYFGKYDKALIYYAQVRNSMKDEPEGQISLFKIAQTAFFRGDFRWAESQLDILKSATSQMIANDALQLKWIITDNNIKSDSAQIALKLFARATLLNLRKKEKKAIRTLDTIISLYKNQVIEDEALLKRGELLERNGQYKLAAKDYQKIISQYPYDICVDDAIYRLALIYDKYLDDPIKAQGLYEQIIKDHSDSVYYLSSRKRYRILRGDDTENL